MATKEEIIDDVLNKSNLEGVINYLSGADLPLGDFEDVLSVIPELKPTGLGCLNTQSYDFQVLKRTLGKRAKIENPEISWKELCGAYGEKHNVGYFM